MNCMNVLNKVDESSILDIENMVQYVIFIEVWYTGVIIIAIILYLKIAL